MATDATRTLTASFRAAELSPEEKTSVLQDLGSDLPDQKKEEVVRALGGGPLGDKPSDKVRDTLYLMVIGALLIILLGCAGVITGVLDDVAKENLDKVVGIFTTVLSFIVGLFVPSPVAQK